MSENKDNNEKKIIKKITIRVTEDEAEKIKKKSMQSYLTQNEYIKRSALDKEILYMSGINALNIQIKRIGNHINQIAKKLNEIKDINKEEKEEILTDLRKERDDLWQLLKHFTVKEV